MNSHISDGIICIIGYNRVENLIDLIKKVDSIVEHQIKIIVSIDYSEKQNIIKNKVESLSLNNGIELILHENNLGLKGHILLCGDYVVKYKKDYILMLEDDIDISEYFFDYINSTMPKIEDNIAGISLYSYEKDEINKFQFKPLHDGYDNYYMQFPSSWGQVWTQDMWKEFRKWLSKNDCDNFNDPNLPKNINLWPKSSWKKHFARYMVCENKYFIYPRISLSSNKCLNGENHINIGSIWSTNILKGEKIWNISKFTKSNSIYNVYFTEINSTESSKFEKVIKHYSEHQFGVKTYLLLTILSIKKAIINFGCKLKSFTTNINK